MPRPKATRRHAMAGAGGLAAATILRWPANAAEFSYKLGASSPLEHPAMARSKEAAGKIKQETNGRLDISVYPSSQLGSDTAMISQVVSGAIQMYIGALDVVASRNPVCGVAGVGFAFASYDQIWAAVDGDLGTMLSGLVDDIGLRVLANPFDHGYRHVTTRTKPIVTPDDLHGFKIRLPVAPVLLALFRHLNASPVGMNFGEVYSALQTGVIDGQENPLVLIDTAKLYEVQKYCSLTGHVWAGLYLMANKSAWAKLPPDLREVAERHFAQAVVEERKDFAAMTKTGQKTLTDKGMIFNDVDVAPFRKALVASGFYPDMKKVVGDKAWGLLEKYVGPLSA